MASMGGGGQLSSLVDEQGTRGQPGEQRGKPGLEQREAPGCFPRGETGLWKHPRAHRSTHGSTGAPCPQGPIGSLLCEPGKGGQGLRARGGPACGFSPVAPVQPGDGRV